MNRVFRVVILIIVALATIATTIEFASAGDRYWRRHHAVKPWKKRVVIGGVTAGIVAGAVIATRPRVIYRDDPVIVDEPPFYDDEGIYGDDDGSVYADPEDVPRQRFYRQDVPGDEVQGDEDYAAPSFDDEDGYATDEPQAENDDSYFPEKPKAHVERQVKPVDRKQALVEKAPVQSVKKKQIVREEASVADLKPWSKEWKSWCADKFPSFNPQNGTYIGYDKKRHFCKAG